MLKVMTIVGTRPELIKMSRVIAELDKYVKHVLVHTGQNYDHELNQVFFDDLEIRKPDHFLGAAGENAAQTMCLRASDQPTTTIAWPTYPVQTASRAFKPRLR